MMSPTRAQGMLAACETVSERTRFSGIHQTVTSAQMRTIGDKME